MEPGQQAGFAAGGHARFGHHLVHRLPVDPRDAGDVLRGLFSRPSILSEATPRRHQFGQHIEGGEILRAQQVTPVAERRPVGRRRAARKACGRPGRTRRGWRSGRPAPRWSGTGRSRPRRAPRGRIPPSGDRGRRPLGRWQPRRLDGRDFRERVFPGQHDQPAPSSAAKATPAALVMVICVEQWIGKSGDSARISRQMPTSCTMAASTPAAMMLRR